MKHVKKTASAGVMAIAMPFIAAKEGLRLEAYLDSVGVPTICYGETEGVRMGDTKTKDECDALFHTRIGAFAAYVDWAIDEPMHPKTHAAFTSIAYNIGMRGFGRSSMHKLYDSGKYREACEAMGMYKYAGGKVLQGLINRRKKEVALCLEGVNDNEKSSANSGDASRAGFIGWLSRLFT
jgi:lysozyme